MLKNGSIYFGKAKHYREIEEKVKGQGDKKEGVFVVQAVNGTVESLDGNDRICQINGQVTLNAILPEVNDIPVFCLFAVYDKDCVCESDRINIRLSDEIKETIKSHFPEADTVAIIKKPLEFRQRLIENLKNIHKTIQAEEVHYFWIEGIPVVDPKTGKPTKANDVRYFQYLIKSQANISGTAYKILWTKDVFFKCEQEYRFVIKDGHVPTDKDGIAINVPISDLVEIEPITYLFNERNREDS